MCGDYDLQGGERQSCRDRRQQSFSGPGPTADGYQHREDEDYEEYQIDYMAGKGVQCHRCGGWGHMPKMCATQPAGKVARDGANVTLAKE